MNIKIESITNPRFADAAGNRIVCQVKFSHLNAPVEFSAVADDVEAHGRAVHAAILAGAAGPIAAYVPPPPPSAQQQIVAIENRNRFTERALREWFLTDVVNAGRLPASLLDPATALDETAPAWLAYPIMLRRAVLAERAIRALRTQL